MSRYTVLHLINTLLGGVKTHVDDFRRATRVLRPAVRVVSFVSFIINLICSIMTAAVRRSHLSCLHVTPSCVASPSVNSLPATPASMMLSPVISVRRDIILFLSAYAGHIFTWKDSACAYAVADRYKMGLLSVAKNLSLPSYSRVAISNFETNKLTNNLNKMKRNLLKTMLVAVGLVAGMSGAWAQETASGTVKMTYVNLNDPDVSYGEIVDGSSATTGYNTVSNGSVGFRNTDWGVNYITYIQVDASAIEGTITKASLSATFDAPSRNHTYGVGYNSSEWSAGMTYNTADKAITTIGATQSVSKNTSSNLTFDISTELIADEDKVMTIIVYDLAAGGGHVTSPSLTVEYISGDQKTADYTVKFVDTEGNELKSAITYTGVVGNTCTVEEKELVNFYSDDNTAKYIYVENNASSQTIAEDGSTVVIVKFRIADKYGYTVNAVDENNKILKTIYDNSVFEGEPLTYSYSKYLTDESGKVTHVCTLNTFANTVTPTEQSNATIEYKSYTGTAYFVEAEDTKAFVGSVTNNQLSGNNSGRSPKASDGIVKFFDIKETGVYNLTYVVFSNNTNSKDITSDVLKNEESLENVVVDWSYNYAQTKGTKTLSDLELNAGDAINVHPSNSNITYDYMLLELKSSLVTVSSLGYATYCPAYPVEFAADGAIEAYKASVDEMNSVVNLTRTYQVAEGEGVLIHAKDGGAATEEVNIIAPIEKDANNAFVGTLEDMTVTEENYGTVYFFGNGSKGLGFYKAANGGTLAAGKAYLLLDNASGAKSYSIAFGGDATGINEVVATAKADDTFYTLSGVRVEKPTKGLYIQNGKKVVIK